MNRVSTRFMSLLRTVGTPMEAMALFPLSRAVQAPASQELPKTLEKLLPPVLKAPVSHPRIQERLEAHTIGSFSLQFVHGL